MNRTVCRGRVKAAFRLNRHLTAVACSLACVLAVAGCANKTPPADVSSFSATAGDKQVVLTWTLPSDANFSGVKIQRKTATAPTSATDGTTAYDGAGATFTDTNLDNGQTYCYGAYAYNASHIYSAGVQTSALPTSATAQAETLSELADLKTSVSSFPSTVFDDPAKAALEGDLAQIDGLYRAGDICGAADATKTYLADLQGLRHDASKSVAEILYNSGRMLRYDMLSTASAKALCADSARIGTEAAADLNPATSDLGQVEATFSFGEPKVFTAQGDGEVYTTLNLPGLSTGTTDVGLPAIPVVTRLVAVPDGATVETSVTVDEAEQILLNALPTQEPGIASSQQPGVMRDIAPPPFTKDEAFYAQDALYPPNTATVSDLGSARGLHIVRLDVPAGQFNPATNTLHLFKSSNVKLTFTGGQGTYGTYDPSNLFEPLQTVQNALLLNSPVLVNLKPQPFKGSKEGAELLIVTHAKFLESANTLAQFKTNSGIITNVVQVGLNAAMPSSADIRNLIVNYWNNSQIKFSYVLLVGDVNYIAPYYFIGGKGTGPGGEPWPPSDFAYSTLGDPAALSTSDWVVGRLPVNETAEADAAVNKIIDYEKNPPTSADFYKHVTLCTDFECCQQPLYGFPGLFDFNPPLLQGVEQQPFLKPLETAKGVLESRGFNVQRLYIESVDAGDPHATPPRPAYTADMAPRAFCDGSLLPADIGSNPPGQEYAASETAKLTTAWNEGRIFIFYNSHGYCNGPGWWGTPFAYWDADGLAQDKPLPVVFSTTCDSGFYDLELNPSCDPITANPCFAEELIRADRRGAVSIIAAPRETLIYVNGHLTEGYASAIKYFGTTTKMRLADVFLWGQGWVVGSCDSNDARTHNHLYHIFGDPSLRIRMQKPPVTLVTTGVKVLLPAAGHLTVNFPTDGVTITAYLNGVSNQPVPVGRGIVKDGVATLQMLTTRFANTVAVGSTLQLVATHPDALPVSVQASVEQPAL